MAEYVGHDLLSTLSSEVLSIILAYLPAKSLLNLSETCHRLRNMCVNCDTLWKKLCKVSNSFAFSSLPGENTWKNSAHGRGHRSKCGKLNLKHFFTATNKTSCRNISLFTWVCTRLICTYLICIL